LKSGNWLISLIGVAISLGSCGVNNYNKKIKELPEKEFSNHWILRLPSDIHKSTTKDELFQDVYTFSGDSMVLKLSTETISTEDALANYESTIKNEKQGIATGPCLGDFKGYAKFHNFLDTQNGLSGTILDSEENGRKFVSFRVEEFKTGNRLDLAFESLSSERKELIHAIVKNIKYKP
jgi:hypothetical protein